MLYLVAQGIAAGASSPSNRPGAEIWQTFYPAGFPAPSPLSISLVKYLYDRFFFEFFGAKGNLTMQGLATICKIEPLG